MGQPTVKVNDLNTAAQIGGSFGWATAYAESQDIADRIKKGYSPNFITPQGIQTMTTFSKTAMLVSLNVRAYGARKEDKKISQEIATTHGTTTDAGKYAKQIVAKAMLDPVTKAASAIRMYHYENTLPWLDEGIRILPAANFEKYKTAMVGLQDTYDSAVREFVNNWPAIIEDARSRLNGMFDVKDYPVDVRSRFGCNVRFMPIPDANDFRVEIANAERDALRLQIEGTLSEASQTAMRDLWERVAEAVKAMASRLGAYKTVIVDGKAKTENPFRDSLVENLRDLCDLIPRLNFAGDTELEAIRQRIESELLQVSPDVLRGRDTVRQDVAARAEDIAKRIAEFMV